MKYGLLLPHFGEEADRDKLLQGARRAEALGFDSLWVRDHLVYEPHGEMERPDRTFYEALTTLTVVGAVTTRIGLGTAALIPFRHPLVLAQTVATMTHLVGPRLVLGLGVGAFDHEFEAVGLGSVDRLSLLRAHVESLRRVMTENDVTYEHDHIRFERVTIEPKPLGGPDPPLALRHVAALGPFGRRSCSTAGCRAASRCARWSDGSGRSTSCPPRPAASGRPSASCRRRRSRRPARRRWPTSTSRACLPWANKSRFAVRPPSGRFETVADLEGQLVAGTPDDVVAECRKFEALGVDQLVFDLRFRFDRWVEQIERLGTDVLPKLGAHLPVGGTHR